MGETEAGQGPGTRAEQRARRDGTPRCGKGTSYDDLYLRHVQRPRDSTRLGKLGVGTSTPADVLEVSGGGLVMEGVHQQSGLLIFGATSAGHYFRLADLAVTTNTGGTYDENELWGTVQYRRTGTAELGQLGFVLSTKQQGPTSAEPTLGFKYRFDGASGAGVVPQLVALRTSAAGATVKTFRLWLLTPADYATAHFLYWYRADTNSVWTPYTAAQDDGTTAPTGVAPDYVGDTLLAVNGGNVGIGTTNPIYPLDVAGTIRTSTGIISGGAILLPIAAVAGLMDSSGTKRIADENGCYYAS